MGVAISGHVADVAINRLDACSALDSEARSLLSRLSATAVKYPPGKVLLEAHDERPATIVILSGWVVRTRDLADGRRQIYSFLLPGDVAAFRASPRGWGSTTVTALTPVQAIDLTGHCDFEGDSRMALACAASLAMEQALIFDQVARLGQRDAYERIIDLFAELQARLATAGLIEDDCFSVPVTHDHLAESLGITPVHVRRVLQRMKAEDILIAGRGHGLTLNVEGLQREYRRMCG